MSEGKGRPEMESIPHWYSAGEDVVSITDGDGARVYDDEGNEYLDFVAQLYCVNAGHSEQRIVDAITEQAQRIPYVSSSKGNDVRAKFAGRLAEVAPGDLSEVFFAVSGSEANETAVQFAREYTGGRKILTRWQSYHGATYGTASLTGDPTTRNTMERYGGSDSTKFLPPLTYRSPFDGDTPEEIGQQAADHLEFVIQNEGPDDVAAVMMEPVGGSSGAYTAPPGYFERVRELCDKYGVLLIADEVITGFGRCGDWFGIGTEDVVPDLLTFAKGATSAYVPMAGVLARPQMGDFLREEGLEIGQTFAGHPLGCAAGVAALDVYEDGLVENADEVGAYLGEQLRSLEEHDVVGDVRGRGLLWSVEFTDPETGDPFLHPWVESGDNPVNEVQERMQEKGVLVGGGRPNVQVLLSPPLTIDRSDVDEAVSALDESIADVF